MTPAQPRTLSHREAQALFPARVDAELDAPGEGQLRAHLDDCPACREGWDRYARAVHTVRAVPRTRAPVHLASLVARRIRRRRLSPRALLRAQAEIRVPYEILIPLLLGILTAALIVLLSP